MLKSVYGNNMVTLKIVYNWYERFKIRKEPVKGKQKSGRPATTKTNKNVQKTVKIIRSNSRLPFRELTEKLNISYGSLQSILTDNKQVRQITATCHTTPRF